MAVNRKKNKQPSARSNEPFNVGDVVSRVIKIKGHRQNRHELARIRWIGKTSWSRQRWFGIEYLRYRVGTHTIHGSKILDGTIDKTNTQLFVTNKKGFGTLVQSQEFAQTSTVVWNKQMSDKCLKMTKFDGNKFADVCTYGSTRAVKHLLNATGYEPAEAKKGFSGAIAHFQTSVVKCMLEHHYGPLETDGDDDHKDDDDEKNSQIGRSVKPKFFSAAALTHVIETRNSSILQLVMNYDHWPLIGDALKKSNEAIYSVFRSNGTRNLAFARSFIDAILQYEPEETVRKYLNFPLLKDAKVSDYNSSLVHAAIKGNNWELLKYLFGKSAASKCINLQTPQNNNECKENEEMEPEPVPLLLCLIMSIPREQDLAKFNRNVAHLEQFVSTFLKLGADVNWVSALTLGQQCSNELDGHGRIQAMIKQLDWSKSRDGTDGELENSHLFYYNCDKHWERPKWYNKNHFMCGSILSAFVYQCSEVLIPSVGDPTAVGCYIDNIIAMLLEHGAVLDHHEPGPRTNAVNVGTLLHAHLGGGIETYPRNVYVYNNRNNQLKVYAVPDFIRCDNTDWNHMLQKRLQQAFSIGIQRHKAMLVTLIKELNIDPGVKIVFEELLPTFLAWSLDYVDAMQCDAGSVQTTPRAYSSDSFMSSGWSD